MQTLNEPCEEVWMLIKGVSSIYILLLIIVFHYFYFLFLDFQRDQRLVLLINLEKRSQDS